LLGAIRDGATQDPVAAENNELPGGADASFERRGGEGAANQDKTQKNQAMKGGAPATSVASTGAPELAPQCAYEMSCRHDLDKFTL